jgi:nucleoside phosphorylase
MRSALKKIHPRLVLSSGFTGALAPELSLGTLVYDRNRTRPERIAQLEALGATAATFHAAERIAITAAEKHILRAHTGCDAVEMESAIIHEICADHGIECITLRAVSDTAYEDLPLDFNSLMKAQHLSIGSLALAILRCPRVIPGLWRLGRNADLAARQLARALNALISFL